jgi:hypothetical protein
MSVSVKTICEFDNSFINLEICSFVFQLQKKFRQKPLSESAETSKSKLFFCHQTISTIKLMRGDSFTLPVTKETVW